MKATNPTTMQIFIEAFRVVYQAIQRMGLVQWLFIKVSSQILVDRKLSAYHSQSYNLRNPFHRKNR